MTNSFELETALRRANLSKKKTAEILGLSVGGLHKKITNKSEFKASEIAKIAEVTSLSASNGNYFFCSK